jgi:hypothetical protein
MRRGLQSVVDPEPKRQDKERARDFFQNHCAYCGKEIPVGSGDIDHLIPSAMGGGNGLANRVLSCKSCNSKEKRDRFWLEFLVEKSPSKTVFRRRRSQIKKWIKINGGHPELAPNVLELLDKESSIAAREYSLACSRIRKAMASRK